MTHALIIDDNLIISRAIQDRLEAFGFNSFDHTWAEHQALDAAALHAPDLIVIGDTMAEGSPLQLAEEQHRMPNGAVVDGPYHLAELDDVLTAMSRGS
jgi:CheY-like chemotaxis protein